MNLRVPKNVDKFLSGWATGGSSRRTHLHGVSQLRIYIYIYIYIYICHTCSDLCRNSQLLSYTYEHTIHNFTCICYKCNNYLVISMYMASSVQGVYSGLYLKCVSYSYSSNLVTWRKVEPRTFLTQVQNVTAILTCSVCGHIAVQQYIVRGLNYTIQCLHFVAVPVLN
jgi:hypothetical protein